MSDGQSFMRLVRAGIDTCRPPAAYMHHDCDVCRAEALEDAS